MNNIPKDIRRWLFIGAAAAVALIALVGVTDRAREHGVRRTDAVLARISDWPESSRLAGAAMLEQYGVPDVETADEMSWDERYPWKRVVVRRDSWGSPLEETVGYRVPAEHEKALKAFGNGLTVDREDNELSARSDREELNILALNMAHEIATGAMTTTTARSVFKTTADRAASGKSSRYMRELVFEPYRPEDEFYRWPRGPLY